MKKIIFYLIFISLTIFLFVESCTKEVEITSEQNNDSNYEELNNTIEEIESIQLSTLIKQEGLDPYYQTADASIKYLEEYTERLEEEGYNTIRITDLLNQAKEYLADAENAILFDKGKGALSLLLNAEARAQEGIEKAAYLENTRSEESEDYQEILSESDTENTNTEETNTEEINEENTNKLDENTESKLESEELIIDTEVITEILNKLPIANLDSSIDIGLGTWANGKFKDFYIYVDKEVPKVQEKEFEKDETKVILDDIPYETLVILYSINEDSICQTIQEEIELEKILYDTTNIGIFDTFKSGVSDLKNCFEG
jgi:hypothetical protein